MAFLFKPSPGFASAKALDRHDSHDAIKAREPSDRSESPHCSARLPAAFISRGDSRPKTPAE
jgi:hypothetical protein